MGVSHRYDFLRNIENHNATLHFLVRYRLFCAEQNGGSIVSALFSFQEPITRSEHLPYLLLELSFLQTELFLERLSRQANNAFVYWPTRAPHYFCNKWINYLEGRGNSKNWIVAGLQVGIQSAFRHIGSTANCTLNLPLRKHIFFAGNSKLKITRSVKTISQPKRERCSLLVIGSCLFWLPHHRRFEELPGNQELCLRR